MNQFSDTCVLSPQANRRPTLDTKEETASFSALDIRRVEFEEIGQIHLFGSRTELVSPDVFKKGRAAVGARSSTLSIDWASHIDREDIVEKTNIDRLALLARKYARKSLSPEDEGRLLIATERMSRLMPRVKEEHFLEMETLAKEIEYVRQVDDKLRKKIDSIKSK